jgi:hypothetical protein
MSNVFKGLGFILWAQVQGRMLDIIYRKLKVRYGGAGEPEYRLPMMVFASLFLPLGRRGPNQYRFRADHLHLRPRPLSVRLVRTKPYQISLDRP